MKTTQRIEFFSAGATYARQEFGVYEYGTHPRSSVLAGRESRSFLDSFETLAEALAKFPTASWSGYNRSGYVGDRLLDLPDEYGRTNNPGDE